METRILPARLALILLPLLWQEAPAGIYKCMNDKGQVHYTDTPCDARDEAAGRVSDDLVNANVVRLPERDPPRARGAKEKAVAPKPYVLDYADEVGIRNLGVSMAGRDALAQRFYRQEIERVRSGLFRRLSFEDRTARDNHLGVIGLMSLGPAQKRAAIRGVEAIYAKYRAPR